MSPTIPPRHRPLLPAADGVRRRLHRISLVWALCALVGLELAGRADRLAHRPGTESVELAVRPLFLVLFAVSTLLALRWAIAGGILATFTAAGILVWEGQQLEPVHAWVVVTAFSVPGLAWLLLGLHDRRPVVAVAGAVAALGVGAVGFGVATTFYDGLLGPTHPDSIAELPAGTRVEWVWTGGVTAHSAIVVAKPDDEGTWTAIVRDVATDEVVARVSAPTDGADIARFAVDGLLPDTRYEVVLDEVVLDETPHERNVEVVEASFRTFPERDADLVIALGSCMRVGTNGKVFDAIAALDPTLFVIDGDFHYADITEPDPDAFRDVLDLNLSEPGPSHLYRSVPVAYVWDDHDYGGNDADSTSPSRSTALSVYREYVPSYVTTGPGDPIYQAFDLGDVRVIMTDARSARSPSDLPDDADKTMLGADQKAWLQGELLAARDRYALTIWVNPVPWIGVAEPGGDGWNGYTAERAEIADFIAANDIDRLLMLSGDAHMVAIDDGTNSAYAGDGSPGFPVLQAGALDRPGSVKGGPYSEGAVPGGGQFGVVEVERTAVGITVRLTGRDWTGATLLRHEFTLPAR